MASNSGQSGRRPSPKEAHVDKITQAQQVLADLAENGGGTYNQRDLTPFSPIAGYAVAIGGAVMPAKDVTADSIIWTCRAVAGEYMTDLVGTWLNEGSVYIDAVRHIRNRETAIRLGQEAGQLAIYDFGAKESIDL
jgi:hypothetical protein